MRLPTTTMRTAVAASLLLVLVACSSGTADVPADVASATPTPAETATSVEAPAPTPEPSPEPTVEPIPTPTPETVEPTPVPVAVEPAWAGIGHCAPLGEILARNPGAAAQVQELDVLSARAEGSGSTILVWPRRGDGSVALLGGPDGGNFRTGMLIRPDGTVETGEEVRYDETAAFVTAPAGCEPTSAAPTPVTDPNDGTNRLLTYWQTGDYDALFALAPCDVGGCDLFFREPTNVTVECRGLNCVGTNADGFEVSMTWREEPHGGLEVALLDTFQMP